MRLAFCTLAAAFCVACDARQPSPSGSVESGAPVPADAGDSTSTDAGSSRVAPADGGVATLFDAGTGVDAGTLAEPQNSGRDHLAIDGRRTGCGVLRRLVPESLPQVAWNATPLSLADFGQEACGLPMANGDGTLAVAQLLTTRWGWNIITPSGASLGQLVFWSGDLFPQPSGFIGYEGTSTLTISSAATFDDSGGFVYGSPTVVGDALFASDPNGGLLGAGQLVPGASRRDAAVRDDVRRGRERPLGPGSAGNSGAHRNARRRLGGFFAAGAGRHGSLRRRDGCGPLVEQHGRG